MRTDTLNRRSRFAPPQPRGERIVLAEGDLRLFEALHYHGPLPSHYLYEFGTRKDKSRHLKRLTKLYNGAGGTPPFLIRPPQQFASCQARYQPMIYDLAPAGKAGLAEAGRFSRFVLKRGDPFVHRFMAACVSASLQLAVTRAGARFIRRDEIFGHAKCPESTKRLSNPLAIPIGSGVLIPDDLFAVKYPKPSYRFFAVEIDRDTEAIERSRLDRSAFGLKIKNYIEVMRHRVYQQHWGIPDLTVLTVTTNPIHLNNMIGYLRSLDEPEFGKRFLFSARSEFGVNWHIPPLMTGLAPAIATSVDPE